MRTYIETSRHTFAQRHPSTVLSIALLAFALGACTDTAAEALPAATLSATFPADATTGVPLNVKISVVFDAAMTPLTDTTFTLKQGATAVAGTVTTSTDGKTATFSPTASLAASTVFTATITTGATAVAGGAFAADRTWTFTTGTVVAPTTAPTTSSTSPTSAATGVALNAKVSVVFNMAMAPLSTTTFTLKQGATAVAGTVATSADGKTATFTPTANLAASTVFAATITTAATSAVGVAFAADSTWSFTTGTTADTTAPLVSGTNPSNNSNNIAVNTTVAATFNEALDPLSMTSATFTLKQGTTAVLGSVAYGPATIATFTPASALTASTLYTASLSTGVKDLQGNALASASTWSFTTGTAVAHGPAVVLLGGAGNYVVLAKAAISTVPTSTITGDIGLSPAAESLITGFDPLARDSTNVYSTNIQIVGKAYASNHEPPTPSNLTTAVSNMEAAYIDAAGRVNPDHLDLNTGDIGGQTLAPGLYKWNMTVTIPDDVVISGGANDVWIFQTTGDVAMTAAKHVTLSGEAQAKNIFWQVAGQVTIGANAHFEGIVLCATQVTLQTGASMNGRILAQTQVALQQATLTGPTN